MNALRAAGATVNPAGAVSQPFFAPQGQVLSVNGEDVQVFEFGSAEEADTVTQSISADGSSIGTSMVGWVAPPHFYRAGQLIVIYVGSNDDVISALQEAMVGLIRSRGHVPKGGYDVPNGSNHTSAVTPAIQ